MTKEGNPALLNANWEQWLSPTELSLFHKFGYYSKPLDGLNGEVIAINSQACNTKNWELFKSKQDPGQQFYWLFDKLRELESQNKFAWIISHQDPNFCTQIYGKQMKALYQRFQTVIRFSTYGNQNLT